MWRNTLILALRAMRRHMLRSFLTLLGVVIGVAAVVTMVTLGNGATRAVEQQIASMGTQVLTVVPGQQLGGAAPPFDVDDATALARELTGVRAVVPVVQSAATVVHEAENWSTSVVGSTVAYFDVGGFVVSDGAVFDDDDVRAGRARCVLGETVRQKLFGAGSPVGRTLRVGNFSCVVVGVLAPKGQSAMGHDQDDTVVMPLRAVQRRMLGNTNVSRLQVAVANGVSTAAVQQQIVAVLRERRRLGEGVDDDFRVMDPKQLGDALSGTTRILTMLLGAVAAVSLLVGGIGIMNIMLVSVTERTREIGIRLAIGALGREVLWQFLLEAVVLSSLGGVLGLVLALGASFGLAALMGVPFVFDPQINGVAFAFSAAIGVVFGFVPARRAARLNPIDALRYE
jgi:putative ABC transport system permease protein